MGVRSKLWMVMKSIYTNVTSCVMSNGIKSRWIVMQRGILQGSALSAKMYLVFINGLLNIVENCQKGAIVADLRVNIPTQADDICLVSTKRIDLQYMLQLCETYSKIWRFSFSSTKSNIVQFSKQRKSRTNIALNLYNCPLPVVDDITHVGVLLNNKFNSTERTLRACNKLRSGTMTLIRSGCHPSALNPLTVSKIIKAKVYPSALYGCELWSLTNTEKLMLERAQHFIVKSIQGFETRTRTDMCTSLLGWTSIEGYIDIKKLLFFGRLCRLDKTILSSRILFTRFFSVNLGGESNFRYGFVYDIIRILRKYKLYELVNKYICEGWFPLKACWRIQVKQAVYNCEEKEWLNRMFNHVDFSRFLLVHNKLVPHQLWKLCIKFPENREAVHYIMKLIVTMRWLSHDELCHKCGKMYKDVAIHIVLQCCSTEELRDKLWCEIININDILFSVYLHSLDESQLFHILIGGHFSYNLCNSDVEDFRMKTVELIFQMIMSYYK